MKKVYTYYFLALLCFGFVAGALSCRQTKELSNNERITVKRDSVKDVRDENVFKASVSDFEYYSKVDTAVGIAGSVVIFDEEATDEVADTVVKAGNATLTRYTGRNGKRSTRCACDSITLVLKAREIYISRKEASFDSLRLLYTATHATSQETTLKEVVKVDTDGYWGKLKGWLSWLGLLVALAFIVKVSVKYYNKVRAWRMK